MFLTTHRHVGFPFLFTGIDPFDGIFIIFAILDNYGFYLIGTVGKWYIFHNIMDVGISFTNACS